ncbi:FecR family protein [Roseateles oligotrophus]|uniref:FecR protein domain-containing protein n=1 Tax=Roseateles oligotrophus TaxID=1769250 RepID=A0ABT2YG71_9BURK|nr:hypothetical protein [Roseateles oligotrophus]MCV2369024.1 hypothetical protein [Roseateles oligotrophus]
MRLTFAAHLLLRFRLAARAAVVFVLLTVCLAGAQAASLAIVSLLEGEAILLRDNARFSLSEGVSLSRDDIIEMGSKGRFILLEFSDGSSLALGPASSVQLAPRLAAERGKIDARIYLLQGWAKVSAAKSHPWAINSSSFDLSGLSQDAVLMVQGLGGQAFAEAGELSFRPLLSGGANTLRLSSGEFLSWNGQNRPELAQRPPGSFLQNIPKAFQDKLPSRAALFQGKDIAPKRLGEISYADAQAWLNAEPALRKANLGRWKPLVRQAEFRKGLVAEIKSHPEWESLLFPPQAASAPPPYSSASAVAN